LVQRNWKVSIQNASRITEHTTPGSTPTLPLRGPLQRRRRYETMWQRDGASRDSHLRANPPYRSGYTNRGGGHQPANLEQESGQEPTTLSAEGHLDDEQVVASRAVHIRIEDDHPAGLACANGSAK